MILPQGRDVLGELKEASKHGLRAGRTGLWAWHTLFHFISSSKHSCKVESRGGSVTHSVPRGEHIGREDSKQTPNFPTSVLDFEDQRVMGVRFESQFILTPFQVTKNHSVIEVKIFK